MSGEHDRFFPQQLPGADGVGTMDDAESLLTNRKYENKNVRLVVKSF